MMMSDVMHSIVMGQVTTTITVSNLVDEILAERGFIPESQVRSVTLDKVIVDTGATRLCLPADVIARLGLPMAREIEVNTAVGTQSARLFHRLNLKVEGRQAEFNCIELPMGQQPLLGVIPLEELGLQPDVIAHKLVVLPERGSETYHLVY
jgi:predicted aspartyl protease